MSTAALQSSKRSLVKLRTFTLHIDCAYASNDASIRSSPKQSSSSVTYVGDNLPINMGLNEVKSLRLTDMRRGGGGRSSFSGIVATVFGAQGFVGGATVNRLAKEGSQIIVPYRGDVYGLRELRVLGDLGQILFTPFHGKDEASIRRALEHSNVVINLIGRQSETRNFSYDDVHVKMSRTIARLSRECGVQRLIHFSALNASPNPPAIIFRKPSKFLTSKYAGELAVREEFPDATIFRPSAIFGNQYSDGFIAYHFSRWVRPLSYLRVPLYASGEKTVKAPVYVTDVSNAVYAAVREPMSVGQTYEIYGPERYQLRELIEYCLRYMRRKSIITPLTPDVFAKAIANYTFHKSLYNVDRMQCAYVSDTYTPGLPTIRDLGIEPTKFSDAIGNIMASMRKSGRYVENPEDFIIPDPPKPVSQEFELSYNVSYP
ncbi:unnamed protein product [Adineta steineri]|uniref:NADH dehydrogenase [ubiquinone] 1 alpha subcomplex subunit 9, mitochondrial n=2 Tax=Bdelloidea TaxID=44578 RepID=A0A814EB42_9BILA|nr:unnamed protein product [Adineta steineri]CAF1090908.1 unnamed protein product [Adineta steineri]